MHPYICRHHEYGLLASTPKTKSQSYERFQSSLQDSVQAVIIIGITIHSKGDKAAGATPPPQLMQI